MKKSVVSMISAGILVVGSTAAFASPLADYSAGKTAVDLTWHQNAIDAKGDFGNDSFDKKGNVDFGVTTGLGGNFALQYNNYDAKSKNTSLTDAGGAFKAKSSLKMQEVNVLYKIDKNVSLYTGIASVKGKIDSDGGSYSNSSQNKLQFGVIGSAPIGSKTTAYAQLGLASNLTNWKVGISQEVAPNVELNIDYQHVQAKKLAFNDGIGNVDMTSKGLGIGLTFKF